MSSRGASWEEGNNSGTERGGGRGFYWSVYAGWRNFMVSIELSAIY